MMLFSPSDAERMWRVRWTNEAYERMDKALRQINTSTDSHVAIVDVAVKEGAQQLYSLLLKEAEAEAEAKAGTPPPNCCSNMT
jgi:hypothetical protein